MKHLKIINGIVDTVDKSGGQKPVGFISVEDNVAVYGGWTDNGDGTFSQPASPPSTNEDINEERDRRVDIAVPVSLSTGKSFTVDMERGGRQNISDLALMAVVKNASGIITDFLFRDADNNDHALTNAEVIEMAMQAANAYDLIYKKSWLLKAADPMPGDITADSLWT